MATVSSKRAYDTLLFIKLYFTTTHAHVSLFSTFTFVFFEHFVTWYD